MSRLSSQGSHSHRRLTWKLSALAVSMFGFGFLLAPLYDLFCDITGIGGRTADTVAAPPAGSRIERLVAVEFVATVNEYAPWVFVPETPVLEVQPGTLYTVNFKARNLADRQLTGQAIPSVAPGQSAKYLKKTECFCFRSQVFGPGESRDLTVQFYLDPQLPDYVDRLTLSYTMFLQDSAVEGELARRSSNTENANTESVASAGGATRS